MEGNPYQHGTPEWDLWHKMDEHNRYARVAEMQAETHLKSAEGHRANADRYRRALERLTAKPTLVRSAQ